MVAMSGQAQTATRGGVNTSILFNSVRGPLFGSSSAVGLRFFGSQLFDTGTLVTANFFTGFPGARSGTIRADRLPIGQLLASAEAGDVFATSRDRDEATVLPNEQYPLLGVAAEVGNSQWRWRSAFGRARYQLRSALRRDDSTPTLLTTQYTARVRNGVYDAGAIGVVDPPYVVAGRARSADAVAYAGYTHELTRQTRVFGQGWATLSGAPGATIGVRHVAERYRIAAAAYHFDERFPDIYPLFRPRETGMSIAGELRPSQSSAINLNANYTTRSVVDRGSSLFGTVSYFQMFGTDRPIVFASYSKSDVFLDQLTGRLALVIADRYTFGVRQANSLRSVDLRGEYVANQVASPDRAQIVAEYSRVAGPRSVITSSAALQREDRDRGAVAEVALERSLYGPYRFLIGVRGAWVERNSIPASDAALRLGLTRRLTRDGWFGRLEARVPIETGSRSTGLAQNSIAAELGRSVAWNGTDAIRTTLLPLFMPASFGAIEGMVTLDGAPFESATILLNGTPAASTDRAGHYRVSRVPSGPATVSIDGSELEPGISAMQGLTQTVMVVARETVAAEFQLGRFKTLQAVVLRCTPSGEVPLGGARVSLIAGGVARVYETSTVGAFRDDALPPGVYDILVDVSSMPGVRAEDVPAMRVDVSDDVLSYFVRIDCGAGGAVRGMVRICGDPAPSVAITLLGRAAVRSATTHADGSFEVSGVPPGFYLVIADERFPRTMIEVTESVAPPIRIDAPCP